MITVKFIEDDRGCIRLTIKGHSGAAPYGQDLICAGVTALTYAAAQAAQSLHERGKIRETPMVCLNPGDAQIAVIPAEGHHSEVRASLWTVQCGLMALAESYPQHIEVQEYLQDYD